MASESKKVETLNNQGMAQAKQRQYQEALQSFSQAIDLAPKQWLAYYNRGNLYAALKQYREAMADFAQVIKLNPTQAQAYLNLGVLLLNHNELKKARHCFKSADKLGHPKAKTYLKQVGQRLNSPQRPPSAKQSGQTAAKPAEKAPPAKEAEPVDAMTLIKRGLSDVAQHQYEDAIERFQQAVERDPAAVKRYIDRGLVYKVEFSQAMANLEKTDTSGAAECVEKLKQLMTGPLVEPAQEEAATQETEGEAAQAEAEPPESGSAADYNQQGLTDLEEERYEEALAKFNKAIELDPDFAAAYSNRSAVHELLQQFDQALADESKAIELDPNRAISYYNRSVLYYQDKKFREALNDLKKALSLNSKLAPAHLNIGVIYLEVGSVQKALTHFEKGAKLGNEQAAQYAAELKKALDQE